MFDLHVVFQGHRIIFVLLILIPEMDYNMRYFIDSLGLVYAG